MEHGEIELFVLWDKARRGEKRILADISNRFEVLCTKELSFECNVPEAWRRFYGPALVDSFRKVKHCGTGPFLLVVVRDNAPVYDMITVGVKTRMRNAPMIKLKDKYRKWVGKKHRVHGTCERVEVERDLLSLTGHTLEEWERAVPAEPWSFNLPDWWEMTAPEVYDSELLPSPHWGAADSSGLTIGHAFLKNKYINDAFHNGDFRGKKCVVKVSSKTLFGIRNEFDTLCKIHAAAPEVTPDVYYYRYLPTGRSPSALVAVEKVTGDSLTTLLEKGAVTEALADSFAADILKLAAALKSTGVLHRDLFGDNLLLGADGHLKAIDWQMAIDRNCYREDVWVKRHWKFRYVVFGVNRDLPLGEWNDYRALAAILEKLPQTDAVKAARERLLAEAPAMTFAAHPSFVERVKLLGYAASLRLQMLLRGKKHRKYKQLERRFRTIVGPRAKC